MSQPLHTTTSAKQSGVQPVHQNTQGVPSSSQDVFVFAPPVPSAPAGTDSVPLGGGGSPAAERGRARAIFNDVVSCAEDTASCVSAGERYSFQSELEQSLSELTPGQLDEAGSGQSQAPQLHPLHRWGRDAPNMQSGSASVPTQPPVLPCMQDLHVFPAGSLPQLSLTARPEEAAWPSGTLQPNCLPQISLTTHSKSHTLQHAHAMGRGTFPQRPLPLHPASLIPYDTEAFTANHQVSSLNTAPGHAPAASNTFTFPQLGEQLPPSLALGTGAYHLPPPPKEAWTTKDPTTVVQQLQDPQEQLEGAKDIHGAPLHSSTFPLLTLAPKQQQQWSFQLLELNNESMHSQFPDIHFPPVKQPSASDLPLLAFPDVQPAEKLNQAPGVTCPSMLKPPGSFSEPFQLLQIPLQPFVPTFPSPDVLGLRPVQLQNNDPFHRRHHEGFKMLDVPLDMPAHGASVHEPLLSEHLAHPRIGAKAKGSKETCTETSATSAGDTRRRRRKEKRAGRKPASSDSEGSMAKTQGVTGKKVVVKQTTAAGLQVSLDLGQEGMKPAHSTQEHQMATKAPKVRKEQNQFRPGHSTTDKKLQVTGSDDQGPKWLTKVDRVVEDEMRRQLARTNQEVSQGKPRVANSDVDACSQEERVALDRGMKVSHPTQEQQKPRNNETVLQTDQTSAPLKHSIDGRPGKELGNQTMQHQTQGGVVGGALTRAGQGSEDVYLEGRDSTTLLLGQPSGVPAREFLFVEDIDPDDTMTADVGDGESTPRAGGFTPQEPMTTSSMSESSKGASQQHGKYVCDMSVLHSSCLHQCVLHLVSFSLFRLAASSAFYAPLCISTARYGHQHATHTACGQ